MFIEAFIAKLSVERLDAGVLTWLARLDQAQLYAAFVCLCDHGLATELFSAIAANNHRQAPSDGQAIQNTRDADT